MQILNLIRKCEIYVILDHKCLSICDSVTSLPCGLERKMGSVSIFEVSFKGNVVKTEKMNQ